jgi:hypothetical protein
VFAAVLYLASCPGISGMAVYESKTSTADFKARMEGNKNMTGRAKKKESMKIMFEKHLS